MSRREPLSHLQSILRNGSILLLSLLVLASIAGAQPPRHKQKNGKLAKEQIESLEFQWRDATVAGDASIMDKLLAEDYVGISWTGQVNTKAMQLDRIRTRTVAVSKMDLNDIKIKVVGPVAIVTSRASVMGTSDGSNINGDFRYTRVYQRIPSGAWQITNFEATRVPSGERMRHREPPPPPPSL
jgi:ketosteroid isomerase-like protein